MALYISMKSKRNPFRVVLTGGPCGGKSTVLRRLPDLVRGLGYDPYPVPEAASLLISAGGRTRESTNDAMFRFQRNTIRVQLAVENAMFDIASSTGQPAAIIFDRGILDAAGFLDPFSWQQLMRQEGLDVQMIVQRYDLVLHLETVAEGGPESYSKANDHIRLETPSEARSVDLRLRDAWSAHPSVEFIAARPSFEQKMQDVSDVIRRCLKK